MIKISPIIPKRNRLDPKRMMAAIDRGLDDAAAGALIDFESTSSTWDHQPVYTVKAQKDGRIVGTKNEVWLMLNAGTKPHNIFPRNAKRLAFPGGPYSAKTRPGFIGSQAGGASGAIIFRRFVRHPGTKPRGWSTIIAKKWRSRVAQLIQRQINRELS
jgi:hypothetical protein